MGRGMCWQDRGWGDGATSPGSAGTPKFPGSHQRLGDAKCHSNLWKDPAT